MRRVRVTTIEDEEVGVGLGRVNFTEGRYSVGHHLLKSRIAIQTRFILSKSKLRKRLTVSQEQGERKGGRKEGGGGGRKNEER